MSGVKPRKLADGSTSYRVAFNWHGTEVSESGGKDRREARRLLLRRRREVADGSYCPRAERKETTIGQWGTTWAENRTCRNAAAELKVLRRLVFSREWFADLLIGEWRVHHTLRLIDELKATPIAEEARRACQAQPGRMLSKKYVRNIYGLVRTMNGAARIAEVTQCDACAIPKKTFSGKSRKVITPYHAEEAAALTRGEAVAPEARVWNAIAFYTGMREGEVCARTWGDYDPNPLPLGCLVCTSQYNDQPLKTEDERGERPRAIPVHPDLAFILDGWWREGWEYIFGRKPTPADRIVPSFGSGKGRMGRVPRGRTLGTHTRSSAYKMWRRACEAARVSNKSLHATRHTFITHARRGGCLPDHLEQVTHNAAGTILDGYTHLGWDPVCRAVSCVNYVPKSVVPAVDSDSRLRNLLADEILARGAAKGAASSQVYDIIVEALGIETSRHEVSSGNSIEPSDNNERCVPFKSAEIASTRNLTAANKAARPPPSKKTASGPDTISEALAKAASLAAAAGQWNVVTQLAAQLEARRRGTNSNVIDLPIGKGRAR